jgi:glycosyltransferase involved in cell wall biosynthesis
MQVSVIIPVYNAADFVVQAVESALLQPETGEVILVEDGSTDKSWDVCQQLAEKHNKVRLFSHPARENRGAGATRNLGMRNSSCEFIAFLDADDYYLPGRFQTARELFEIHPDCEGVYEAVGLDISDRLGQQRLMESKKSIKNLQTMTKRFEPENLWMFLISGEYGDFHLDGLVLRRNVLSRSGYMSEGLRLHQDTEFIIRLSVVARLMPGKLEEPVAMWRAHAHNRISAPRSVRRKYFDLMQFWMETYTWSSRYRHERVQKKVLERMIVAAMASKHFFSSNVLLVPATFVRTVRLLAWLVQFHQITFGVSFQREVRPTILWKMIRGQIV